MKGRDEAGSAGRLRFDLGMQRGLVAFRRGAGDGGQQGLCHPRAGLRPDPGATFRIRGLHRSQVAHRIVAEPAGVGVGDTLRSATAQARVRALGTRSVELVEGEGSIIGKCSLAIP